MQSMKTVTVSGLFLSAFWKRHIGETVVDILSSSCEMLFDHVNKCRTAGGGHLLPLFISPLPTQLLLLQRSYPPSATSTISAKPTFFNAVFQRHGNVAPKLALGCRCHHGYLLAGIDHVDDIYHKGFGADCRTDSCGCRRRTGSANFIDLAYAILVVGNRVYRAGLLTGAQMCDRVVRAGICALAALLTLVRIDVGTGIPPC